MLFVFFQIILHRGQHPFIMTGAGNNFSDDPAGLADNRKEKQLELVFVVADLRRVGILRSRNIIGDFDFLGLVWHIIF